MTLITGIYQPLINPEVHDLVQLLTLLPSLPKDRNYLILEASAETNSYMQGRPETIGEDVFRIEYRDGPANRHFLCWLDSIEEAFPVFATYLVGGQSWQHLIDWKDISHSFPDLRQAGRTEIPLESEFFNDDEWQARKSLRREKIDEWNTQFENPDPFTGNSPEQ